MTVKFRSGTEAAPTKSDTVMTADPNLPVFGVTVSEHTLPVLPVNNKFEFEFGTNDVLSLCTRICEH